jgi:hypothetical protein
MDVQTIIIFKTKEKSYDLTEKMKDFTIPIYTLDHTEGAAL